LIKSRN